MRAALSEPPWISVRATPHPCPPPRGGRECARPFLSTRSANGRSRTRDDGGRRRHREAMRTRGRDQQPTHEEANSGAYSVSYWLRSVRSPREVRGRLSVMAVLVTAIHAVRRIERPQVSNRGQKPLHL